MLTMGLFPAGVCVSAGVTVGVGAAVGSAVGAVVGASVGLGVGEAVGSAVGVGVGASVASGVAVAVGGGSGVAWAGAGDGAAESDERLTHPVSSIAHNSTMARIFSFFISIHLSIHEKVF